MFVLLSAAAAPRGRAASRRLQRRLRRMPAVRCAEANALPFLTAEVFGPAPDWAALAAHCGRCVGQLVPPAGLTLPADPRFRRYDAGVFRSRVLLRSACALLAAAGLPPQALTVTLCDRSGLLADAAPSLLPYAARVRILTAAPARYAPVCVAAMQSCGAALLLRDHYRPAGGPELVIAGSGVPAGLPRAACLLTAGPAAAACTVLPGGDLPLRPTHAALLPAGVEAADFAGALTTLCACPDYRSAVFPALTGDAAVSRLRAWFAAANQKVTKF